MAAMFGLGRLKSSPSRSMLWTLGCASLALNIKKTSSFLDLVGLSYWLHGQYHEGLDLQQLITGRMVSVLGPDRNDTLTALDNLGVTLVAWHRFQETWIFTNKSSDLENRNSDMTFATWLAYSARRAGLSPTHRNSAIRLKAV